MKVIAGLGNPGKEYENTRHNAGFMAVERIAARLGVQLTKAKHKAITGETVIDGEKLMLVKPMTFMNSSGDSIAEILKYYGLTPEDIVIVYDDESLPAGTVRARESGSDGGHNGMKSIISRVGTQCFMRVRIGIGAKPDGWDLADYVLGKFSESEKPDIESAVNDAADCALMMFGGNAKEAMSKYNKHNRRAAGEESTE